MFRPSRHVHLQAEHPAFRRPCRGFQQLNKREILCRNCVHPGRLVRSGKDPTSAFVPGRKPATNIRKSVRTFSQGTPVIPMKIRKAVFPVAGLGTRVLPATKAMPKEMLTIVDKPLIQYVVDEAKEAGIEHFIFVTGRNKGVIEDHFDRMYRARRHARRARQEGRDGHPGARPAGSRRHELYPPAGAARARPRGVVRARHRRQRAVRGGAAGRTGAATRRAASRR